MYINTYTLHILTQWYFGGLLLYEVNVTRIAKDTPPTSTMSTNGKIPPMQYQPTKGGKSVLIKRT